jgi:hypothetical protein
MQTECLDQLTFSFYDTKEVVVNYKGGEITSDAGLVLLRQFDKYWGLTKEMNKCISDRRMQNLIDHEQLSMLRQRIYQIVAGYEDADDCDLLRNDPTIKLVANKVPLSDPLASQPTVSRLENRISWEETERLNDLMVRWFIKTRNKKPKEIILDFDTTDDPAYGGQQLVFFNSYYDELMYHPLLLFEGKTGHLLSCLLRRGNAYGAECADETLAKVIDKLQERFAYSRFLLRGDSAFGVPRLYDLCEAKGVQFLLGIKGNSVLKKRVSRLVAKAKRRYRRTKNPVECFTSFFYRAKSWERQRRILAQIKVDETGESINFLVTTLKGRAKKLFSLYHERGECENRIKELKLGFFSGRTSCETYLANAFRLTLHGLAYNLVNLFREIGLAKTELAQAQIDTLRFKLFKIGAWVKESVRRVWIRLASAWPYRSIFGQIYLNISHGPPISA